jgi:hypothetical protein
VFKRRRDMPAAPRPTEGVHSVLVLEDGDAGTDPEQPRVEAWSALRRLVAEALILQDSAEELLIELRDHRDLGAIAPRCGRLMSRFVALDRELPASTDPAVERYCSTLRTIFDHHVLLLNSARAMLAVEWRSEKLTEQLDRIDGLGEPARRLEAVRADILLDSSR